MIYKNRTFMVSDETGVLKMVAYNDQGSILGLTANKSTVKNVKTLLGAKFNYEVDEEEGWPLTLLFNKGKTRFINIGYDENDKWAATTIKPLLQPIITLMTLHSH